MHPTPSKQLKLQLTYLQCTCSVLVGAVFVNTRHTCAHSSKHVFTFVETRVFRHNTCLLSSNYVFTFVKTRECIRRNTCLNSSKHVFTFVKTRYIYLFYLEDNIISTISGWRYLYVGLHFLHWVCYK